MPEAHLSIFASASFPAFDSSPADDYAFGDFTFAPTPLSQPPPPQQEQQEDDEWGDFFVSPAASSSQNPQSSFFNSIASPQPAAPPSGGGAWEKPRGALPLSLFGEEEAEAPELALESSPLSFSSTSSPFAKKDDPAAGGDLTDLIKNMYREAANVGGTGDGNNNSAFASVGGNGDYENSWELRDGDGEFEESIWEFQDAFSQNAAVKENGKMMDSFGMGKEIAVNGSKSEVGGDESRDPLEATLHLEIGAGNGHINGIADSFKPVPAVVLDKDTLSEAENVTTSCEHFAGGIIDNNLSESNPINSYNPAKKELDEKLFTKHNDFTWDPIFSGNGKGTVHGLDNNILELHNQAGQANIFHPSQDARENGQSPLEFQQSKLMNSTLVDLYCRLKDGSIFLIEQHLNDLKKAQEVVALSGDKTMEVVINGKIHEAHKKLLEAKVTDTGNMGKYTSVDACFTQMLKAVQESNFQAYEQEYHLSKRILLAEKNLGTAIELLEHTSSILHTLSLVPKEEWQAYITAWSKMAVACLQELQHGAMIWRDSVNAYVSTPILYREHQYFIALGEIYRISEILRTSVKLYKPWILSNKGDSSELLSNLDKCVEAWITSGLEKALETISEADDIQNAGVVKPLLASIKALHDLKDSSLQNNSHFHGKSICKFSLLPVAALQEMELVLWNGEHYYVKLANLWANRVSHDPPQLPPILFR